MTTLADLINTHGYSADTVTRACVDLVRTDASPLGQSDMYASLIQNARDSAGVDQMLYQLAGDPAYAERAALLVLSAAWNNEDAVEPIQRYLADASESGAAVESDEAATTVLYGMYRVARGGAPLREVTFRGPSGAVESRELSETMMAASLFDAVRDLY